MRLDDGCPMPWGKYKGQKMANVPADYLLWLYDNNKCDAAVKQYVEENLQGLKEEVKRNQQYK